jgi:hypothetical protein
MSDPQNSQYWAQQAGGQYQLPATPPGYEPPQGQGPYGPPPQWQPQPPRRKRHTARNLFLGIGSALLLIIVIAAVASSGNAITKNSPGASTGGSSAPSQNAADNNTTGPIGTTFTITTTNENGATVKYSVTLDQVIQHAQPDNSFDTAPAGDHLAAAKFTIKGVAGNDQDDANSDAAAVGDNQQTYQPGFEGLAAGTNFDSGQFNTGPGSSSVGWVSFEVKNGITITSIQWSPDAGFSSPATWTLSG